MLIRFSVKNFLSFNTDRDGTAIEFSMIAGKARNKREHTFDNGKLKLLKFAAVYGANASGKSNLVKAIDFMRNATVSKLPQGYSDKYCKINPINKNEKSYFELEIYLDGKYYAYGFEILLKTGEFLSEWLIELNYDNSEKVIFTRDILNGNYEIGKQFTDKKILKKLNVYLEDIKSDESILFLTLMNQNKKSLYVEDSQITVFRNVFLWIRNELDINYPNSPISDYSYFEDSEKIEELYRIISAFGTGITGFKLVDVPFERVINRLPDEIIEHIQERIEEISVQKNTQQQEVDDINEDNGFALVMRSNSDFFTIEISPQNEMPICKTIQFSHGKDNILFELGEESDGTIRILDLIEILICKDQEKVYIIDELDRCLHPSLTFKFIDTFLQLAEERNIQLVVTTHESRLMDFDLLRRDEIWFVDKEKSGESRIYSLEEYNTRFDQKIDKAYLEGRYGGVPIFSTVFPVRGE